ncbi:hypothetical protein HMPREF2785_00320 [Corynebacterium sp. HMSC067D03]|uniref:hypothetical protein n=1 Tax=unclassified Corynebacterium TaxID=2624378 RepID=UPI0008A46E5E|nr:MULTISPECIES: hypothetical protein [unclassified Corynebacterium]OFL18524.1 hypothetical protein HMPREF2785_00320 [Corynebacterium sp. HMSC067D03]OHO82737.1 hypothetical protein HMPREF2736_03400 [Corynebacterium sp. HMSC036E10]
MKRTTVAVLAATTALSLATVPAHGITVDEARAQDEARNAKEVEKLIKKWDENGYGAMPNTYEAGYMAGGSVKAGSSGEQAYGATQAGWVATWIAVSAAGLGLIAFAAKQAGVLPPQIAGQLPF